MMNYKEHLTGGIGTAILPAGVAYYNTGWEQVWLVYLTSVIFSLFPDMDTGSKSRRHLILLGAIPAAYFGFNDMMIPLYSLLALMIIPTVFKHRGFTHSMVGMIVFAGIYFNMLDRSIGMVSPEAYALAVETGYLTHLILDNHWRLI